MIKFEGSWAEKDKKPECVACEGLLADEVDGVLSAGDQAWFDEHAAGCAECSAMLGDARRGAAWLELLKYPRPEPSAGLLERILASTESGGVPEELPAGAYVPVVTALPQHGNVLPFRPRMPLLPRYTNGWMEPRLAMTAAMAFFSIALTLNLSGVKLNQLHASDLRPTNLKQTFFQTKAQSVRYCDNLRVVQVLESRVDELRVSGDDKPRGSDSKREEPKPEAPPEQKDAPKRPEGTSRRELPMARPETLPVHAGVTEKTVAGTTEAGLA